MIQQLQAPQCTYSSLVYYFAKGGAWVLISFGIWFLFSAAWSLKRIADHLQGLRELRAAALSAPSPVSPPTES